MSAPTGPAGGDLGGTYPNPTVVNLAHAPAGGDLSGSMDAPIVIGYAAALAAITALGIAVAPVGRLYSEQNHALDGAGFAQINTPSASVCVVCWGTSPGAGQLYVSPVGGGSFNINSTLGAPDAGFTFNTICF